MADTNEWGDSPANPPTQQASNTWGDKAVVSNDWGDYPVIPGTEKTGLPGVAKPVIPPELGGPQQPTPYSQLSTVDKFKEGVRLSSKVLGLDQLEKPIIPLSKVPAPIFAETIASGLAGPVAGLAAEYAAKKYPAVSGVTEGLQSGLEQLTTPENLGLAAATDGLGIIPKIGQYLPPAISAIFGIKMLKGAADKYPEVNNAIKSGDAEGVAKAITEIGVDGLLGIAALSHPLGKINSAVAAKIDAHNTTAARLINEDLQPKILNPDTGQYEQSGVQPGHENIVGEPAPIETQDGTKLNYQRVGALSDHRPIYNVTDESGKVINQGTGANVGAYLRSRGALLSDKTPLEPPQEEAASYDDLPDIINKLTRHRVIDKNEAAQILAATPDQFTPNEIEMLAQAARNIDATGPRYPEAQSPNKTQTADNGPLLKDTVVPGKINVGDNVRYYEPQEGGGSKLVTTAKVTSLSNDGKTAYLEGIDKSIEVKNLDKLGSAGYLNQIPRSTDGEIEPATQAEKEQQEQNPPSQRKTAEPASITESGISDRVARVQDARNRLSDYYFHVPFSDIKKNSDTLAVDDLIRQGYGFAVQIPGAVASTASETQQPLPAAIGAVEARTPSETPAPQVRKNTGTINEPLNQDGQQQAKEMASSAKVPFDKIIAGPSARTQVTAQEFSEKSGKPVITNEAFGAAARGNLEGQPVEDTKEQLKELLANPEKPAPGVSPSGVPGETQAQYEKELFHGLQGVMRDFKPGQRVLIVTHGGGIAAANAWAKAGFPEDFKHDHAELANEPTFSATGKFFRLMPNGVEEVDNDDSPGVYLIEHAATDSNPLEKKDESADVTQPEVRQNIPRQETLDPTVAAKIAPGSTRINHLGGIEKLQEVPLSQINAAKPTEERSQGNELYPKTVAKYIHAPSAVAPELREQPDGTFEIHEGHHRVEAARRTSQQSMLAWTSKPNAQGYPQTAEEAEKSHSFASSQFNLPGPIAGMVRKFAATIPDNILTDKGREDNPHITLKYGLQDDDPTQLQAVVAGQGPIKVEIDEAISIFNGPDADVIKINVSSPELTAMHEKIKAEVPNQEDYPSYQGHITIAYVRPGEGAQYAGKPVPRVTGTNFTVGMLTFSDRDGNITPIPLTAASSKPSLAPPSRPNEAPPAKPDVIDGTNTESATPSTEGATIGATNEPVRPQDNQPLAGQLSGGAPSTSTERPASNGSGVGGSAGSPGGIGRPSEGSELGTSAGTISGVVGDPAEPEITFPPRAEDVVSTHLDRDYRIPDDRVISGTQETRARYNIYAIKTLRDIQAQNRPATVEEQKILANYVGWGQVPQLFADRPGFAEMHAELKSLLSPEEYDNARRSTTNAHYTSDEIVDAMWTGMQHLGAQPGMAWLEPSVGVGNFFGRQPEALMEGTRRIGLDKDSVSSQIAKLLYPDSGIENVAYEDADLPRDYFDAAISNVPFGDFGVHDPEFRGKSFLTHPIHNYFFAKALTQVRPGGVIGFITSRHTMDNYGQPANAFRKYVSSKADFLGAVRLPSGAFRQSSGTDVITDVIFMRRRMPGAENTGEAWQNTDRKNLSGWSHDVNEYYTKHPEMILGTEGIQRGQFAQHDYDVKGDVTKQQIVDALKKIAPNQFQKLSNIGQKPARVSLRDVNVPELSKIGGLFFDKDGNLYRRTSKGTADKITDADEKIKQRIRGQMQIRDAFVNLIDAEQANKSDGELAAKRAALNQLYDNYVDKNGFLSMPVNVSAMSGDPDAPRLLSLERKFDKGNKSKDVKPQAEKHPIFTRRMFEPQKAVTTTNDPKDALYLSLNEKGRVDWPYMSGLTGRPAEQLQSDLEGLVFQNPTSKLWETADEYLSGSVRKKLKNAQAISKIDPQFKVNADALAKVQPGDIAPGDISALLGVTWVPIGTYSQFATELLGAEHPVSVKYAGGEWKVDPQWGRMNNSAKWRTARVEPVKLLQDSLNMQRTKVTDRDDDGKTTVNPTETKAARARQMEMQAEFEKWLFADPKRAQEITRIYNDTQNDLRERIYGGSHLTLPGMSRIILRNNDLDPHQKAAIWRQISQPNVLLAHSVGSGKTFEAIAGAEELKRLGLIKRPMFVVPNSTLSSWQEQYAALYPQSRVLVFSEKDLNKKARQKAMAQIATGDWDSVVVPHSSFQFLPTGDDIFNEHFNKLSSELEDQISEAKEANLDTRQIKRMEKAKERLLTSLRDKRKEDKKDQTVSWEQLGIDHLVIDESHEYKKLGFSTKQGNVAGIDQNGNQKTFDLLMKLRYTQKFGRGAVFMTGTPITNTMGELFNVMKYLVESELQARGMGKFDEWAANFGRTVDVFEPKIEGGGYQMKARFAEFVNLPELSTFFRSFADVVTPNMINLPKPELVTGDRQAVKTDLTPEQEDYLEELRERASNIRQDPRNALPDNMLAIFTDASKMAMDIRMVRPESPDDPRSRLNKAADKIYDLWNESHSNLGTQVVFSDFGKPAEARSKKSRSAFNGFSAYDDLIQKLTDRGIPRDQIAHIYQAKNKDQRAKLFQKVRDGKIRVLLASTAKAGVGVNIQDRLYALHHLDIPHRPSDLEQREGRILRQGNTNPSVHVLYYLTIGSLDEAKFGHVVRKAKFTHQVLEGKAGVRKMEDVGGMIANLGMFQAMTSNDPRVMKKMELDAEIDRLGSVYSGWKNQQYKTRTEIAGIPGRILALQNRVERLSRDKSIADRTGNKWQVGDKTFEGDKLVTKEVNDALSAQLRRVVDNHGEDVQIGYSHGLPLLASLNNKSVSLDIGDSRQIFVDVAEIGSGDVYRRITNQIDSIPNDISNSQENVKRVENERKNLEASLQDVWPYEQKFKDLIEEQQKLVKELGADKGDEAAEAVESGGEITDSRVTQEDSEEEPDEDEGEPEGDEESAADTGVAAEAVAPSTENKQAASAATESRSSERGSVNPDIATLYLNQLAIHDVLPALTKIADGVAQTYDDAKTMLIPQARGGGDVKLMEMSIRQRNAERAHRLDVAGAAMSNAREYMQRKGDDFGKQFILTYFSDENGPLVQTGNKDLDEIAKVIRKYLDSSRDHVQNLGTGKLRSFFENYFPHIWKDPKKAEGFINSFFSKRPLEGKKSFLKQRKYINIADGINAGLEPVSWNPIDLVLAKIAEVERYVMAHQIMKDAGKIGIRKYVPAIDGHAPYGYSKVKDAIGTIYGRPIQDISEYPNEGLYTALMNTANALGLKVKRGFNLKIGEAVGTASRPGDIKVKHGTAEDVLAHEIGHHIDWMVGGSGAHFFGYGKRINQQLKDAAAVMKDPNATPQERVAAKAILKNPDFKNAIGKQVIFNKELRALADLRSGSKRYTHKKEEKMALLAEMWVGAREAFQKTAPNVFAEWKKFLNDNPKLHTLRDIKGNTEVIQLTHPYDVGGLVINGNYYLPKEVNDLLNNFLSPGLRNKGWFKGWMGANNTLQLFQLGFSGFHPTFTTLDSVVSNFSIGMENLFRGNPGEAMSKMITSFGTTPSVVMTGDKILKEWNNPGSQGQIFADLVKAVEMAGGRARMEEIYGTKYRDQIRKQWSNNNLWGVAWRSPFVPAEAITDLIMREIVPRTKLGVFAKMATDSLKRMPSTATLPEIQRVLAQAWDEVDNRLGQLVYDNLFWNKTILDIAMGLTRSVGWNLGALRAIGGAPVDVYNALRYLMSGGGGNRPPLHVINLKRLSYVISLFIVNAIFSAIYQKVAAKKNPESLYDLVAPQDGTLDNHGNPNRIFLPFYTGMIVEAKAQGAGRFFANKASPMLELMLEMYRNEDFYGKEIYHPGDLPTEDELLHHPVVSMQKFGKFMLDTTENVAKAGFTPFTIANAERTLKSDSGTARAAQNFFGIRSVPARVNMTQAERLAQDLELADRNRASKTEAQFKRSEAKAEVRHLFMQKSPKASAKAREYVDKGLITNSDVTKAIVESRIDPLSRTFANLGLRDQMKVWDEASPAERAKIKPLFMHKFATTMQHLTAEERSEIQPEVQKRLAASQ